MERFTQNKEWMHEFHVLVYNYINDMKLPLIGNKRTSLTQCKKMTR